MLHTEVLLCGLDFGREAAQGCAERKGVYVSNLPDQLSAGEEWKKMALGTEFTNLSFKGFYTAAHYRGI